MRKVLLMLAAVLILSGFVTITADNTKNVDQAVLAPAANSMNIAAAMNAALRTAPVNMGKVEVLDLAAVSAPPNSNVLLMTTAVNVQEAQWATAAITAVGSQFVDTGPPTAAIVLVNSSSPPSEMFAMANGDPPNAQHNEVVVAEIVVADNNTQGAFQGGVAARANLLT